MNFQNGFFCGSKFLIICFIILCNLFSVSKSFASGKVNIEAHFLDYESVCKLNSPQNPPSSIIWSKGKWSQQGCSSIEKTFDHPPALKIVIKNDSGEEYRFSVNKNFDNFARKDAKLFYNPVAIQILSGGFLGYITQIPNTLKLVVDANKEAEIVVFFEEISIGSKIQFEGFDLIEIK